MKARSLLVALLLFAPLAAALLPTAAGAGSLRLVVLGDTDTTTAAKRNVDGAVADGAQGIVGTGDYYYYSTPSAWKTMFAPLTSKGAHLSIGNHDERSALAEFFPEGTQWTRNINGVRFVALNSMRDFSAGSTDYNQIRGWLCGASEPVKVLVMHHNWWLGSAAHHPGSEFRSTPATMDKLLTDCGVDLVLAGHEHNYQRMVKNGIQYVIMGTGGRSLYPLAGMPSGTVATYGSYGRLMIDVSSTGISASFKALDNSVKDTFTVGGGASSPSPSPSPTSGTTTFTPKGGSEWWVQVAVSGSPTGVSARDTNGAWVPLTLRSWGDWAGSFRVEAGHDVQYRATYGDGRVAESCWYDHPRTTCASSSATPSTGSWSATFRNVRGNAWWVETDVSVSGATLKGVEARSAGGAWTPLDLRSYGSWAKSMRTGSTVELRAVATDGTTSATASYAWPPG